jgi:hypothetical protein
LKFSDGTEYEGDILNGEAHGIGILRVPNGTVFEGEFKNNFIFGEGTMHYSNGGGKLA